MTAIQSPPSLLRYAWLSILTALATMALKAWAWWLTGSIGLLSDALESIVNLVAALFALAMLTVAASPPDEHHHFGHTKAEYFSSGVEGVLILAAAAAIIYTAYQRLLQPQPLNALDVGLGVSFVASLLNWLTARILLRAGKLYRSITLVADAKHLLTDVWTSLGVIFGLAAVTLTGWQDFDPWIAIVVAINIFWSGLELIKRSIDGLLDVTLPNSENKCIVAILDDYASQGIQYHRLQTRQAGRHRFISVHILVPGETTVQAGHDLLNRIEHDIRIALGGEIAISTHLEPLDDPTALLD